MRAPRSPAPRPPEDADGSAVESCLAEIAAQLAGPARALVPPGTGAAPRPGRPGPRAGCAILWSVSNIG